MLDIEKLHARLPLFALVIAIALPFAIMFDAAMSAPDATAITVRTPEDEIARLEKQVSVLLDAVKAERSQRRIDELVAELRPLQRELQLREAAVAQQRRSVCRFRVQGVTAGRATE